MVQMAGVRRRIRCMFASSLRLTQFWREEELSTIMAGTVPRIPTSSILRYFKFNFKQYGGKVRILAGNYRKHTWHGWLSQKRMHPHHHDGIFLNSTHLTGRDGT
jgi:hypothetical protein